jgi:hypothetical protein
MMMVPQIMTGIILAHLPSVCDVARSEGAASQAQAE